MAAAKGVEWGERIVAAILLALSAPLISVVAVAIALLSRRSPFVAHLRVARDGRDLWVLKLRTMWERGQPAHWTGFVECLPVTQSILCLSKLRSDCRVPNAFARLCRRYSIDELPQLWSVVRGEMSLIGPRPLTRIELEQIYGCEAARLLSHKPGLTGLWQIRGRSRLSYRRRRRLDLFLIRHRSLKLYLRILLATVPKVLTGKDAW